MKRWWIILLVCSACTVDNAERYYLEGRALREANKPVEAMKSFLRAARTPACDYAIQGRSYSNMGTMCRMGERHDLAYSLYERSAASFALSGDSLAYAYALNNMAWEQAVQGNKTEAMCLVDSALHFCPQEVLCEKVRETQAAACLYAEEYDSVLYYTQFGGPDSVYMDILRAQAYTFLEHNDSAVYYARRVLEGTDNPRYLDDVYYILTHCDSTSCADEIRSLAATRTDVQCELERHNAAWIEAMSLAEQAITPPHRPSQIWVFILIALIIGTGVTLVLYRYRSLSDEASELEQVCRSLRKSANLKSELEWNDYTTFCRACNARLFGIADKLQQRGLTEREIRICVLVLIGFSYAEIADILYRAESGIGKDKYMIAKHLDVSVKDLQATLRAIAVE